MTPKIIQHLKDAKKPCFATCDLIERAVLENLTFLADTPFDAIGPNRFEYGLKKLSDYIGCKLERRNDFTYHITIKN